MATTKMGTTTRKGYSIWSHRWLWPFDFLCLQSDGFVSHRRGYNNFGGGYQNAFVLLGREPIVIFAH